MIRRPLTWLVIALIGGALIAGCGSSSSSTTSSAASATTSSTPAATTSSTPALSGADAASVQAAVAACKQTIRAQSTLPAGSKSKLEAICEKAAKGDQTAVKKVAQEVCEEVVKNSPVPPGAARETALAACKQK
jgi:pectin methylesterase-like acyl-CoA thioesterase